MPQSGIIHRNRGIDLFGPGQLVEDNGIIFDLEGGFDTASFTLLIEGAAGLTLGSKHPDFPHMYLFGISPRRSPGDYRQTTLTYRGLTQRNPGSGEVPTEGSGIGIFTYGAREFTRTWPKGEGGLTGTVPGLAGNPQDRVINVKEFHKTVHISWVGTARISDNIYNLSGGRGARSFGPIDESFYSSITNAAYNYPNGWVAETPNSVQVAPGIPLWHNTVTFVATPKFSPA